MNNHVTSDGIPFVIRKPGVEDAENIIQYSKQLFASTDQLLTTVEEYTITAEGEKTWITNSLNNPSAMTLVAEAHEKIVGLIFFVPMTKKKNCHTGEFGVSVHPAFQGAGLVVRSSKPS